MAECVPFFADLSPGGCKKAPILETEAMFLYRGAEHLHLTWRDRKVGILPTIVAL
jgi:hypothetical protein